MTRSKSVTRLLAELDQDNAAMFASDVAVILAEAGRDELALARVEQNLRRFPGDLWTQIHAGDVHLTLSDPARAEQTFRDALAKSRSRGDASGSRTPTSVCRVCSASSPAASRKPPRPSRRWNARAGPRTAGPGSLSRSDATIPAHAAADASTSAAAEPDEQAHPHDPAQAPSVDPRASATTSPTLTCRWRASLA
jgi:hypothetical protein